MSLRFLLDELNDNTVLERPQQISDTGWMRYSALLMLIALSLSAHAGQNSCEGIVSNELSRLGLGSYEFPKVDKVLLNQDSEKFRSEMSQLTQEHMIVTQEIQDKLVETYTKRPNESLDDYSKRVFAFTSAAIARAKGQTVPDKIAPAPEAEKMIRDSFSRFEKGPQQYAEALVYNVLYTAPGNTEYYFDRDPRVKEIDRRLKLLKSQFHQDRATIYFDQRDVSYDSTTVFGNRDAFSVRVFLKDGKIQAFETVARDSPGFKKQTLRAFRLQGSDCKIMEWMKSTVDAKGEETEGKLYNLSTCQNRHPLPEECAPYLQYLAGDGKSGVQSHSVDSDTSSSSYKAGSPE
jgi:hypothetical protein